MLLNEQHVATCETTPFEISDHEDCFAGILICSWHGARGAPQADSALFQTRKMPRSTTIALVVRDTGRAYFTWRESVYSLTIDRDPS